MDFQSLYIRNFLTVGEASMELDNRGLILIQGINNDDPSAKSNGAGKSSIVDALFWVLYGETARGVSGDDVINETAGKDCHVRVVVEDGHDVFEISRGRKSKEIKNALVVKQLAPTSNDLTKGTDKETQKVVEKIIGASKEVFTAAVYAGQERMPDLPGMTDKQLKLLIEEAAGVEVLSDAYAEARKRALQAENDRNLAASQLTSAKSMLQLAEDELKSATEQRTLFESQRKDKARAELAKVAPVNAEITGVEVWLSSAAREEVLTAQIDAAQAKLDAQKAEQAELDRLNGEVSRAERDIASHMATLQAGKRDLEVQAKALANIEEQVGKPCGECGKAYCEHDLEAAKTARTKRIAEKKAELMPVAANIRDLQAVLEKRKQAATDFKASMTDVSEVARENTRLNALLNDVRGCKRKVATLTAQIDGIKKAAKGHLEAENPWVKVEARAFDKRTKAADAITAAETALGEADKVKEIADVAVKVFGPAGVRAHILDTVTPMLNDQTSDYLGVLADGNIHATWNTLAKTAKGDLKEKFNIEVSNDKGAKSFAGLSGGEKRKARVAASMALQDMVATRAAKPINLWVGDEIDHALDEAGLERLMTVLERKARERGTVLVISHNSLADWIDNVIVAEKTGGITTVSGATERGF
ncbi:AAA family ATPase [Paraburkholderia sp.]|uniref:AAA family ATPase n=1 Tax=Paraburkholderia sp. TaxID=1926495 RepID=UPI0039E40A40